MLLIYELVQLVGPGARKPSVGEGIQSRRPLNQLQSSLFIAFFPLTFIIFCTYIGIGTARASRDFEKTGGCDFSVQCNTFSWPPGATGNDVSRD